MIVLTLSLKNWNFISIKLSVICLTNKSYDLFFGHLDFDNDLQWFITLTTNFQTPVGLEATDLSSTHLIWQNIKEKLYDLFKLIYRSRLAGELLKSFHITFDIQSYSYPVAFMPVWKAKWITWRPQDPISKIWCNSFFFLWAFSFSKTLQ